MRRQSRRGIWCERELLCLGRMSEICCVGGGDEAVEEASAWNSWREEVG